MTELIELIEKWDDGDITHYQPIIVPKPPKY